jgi:hypothetical protein
MSNSQMYMTTSYNPNMRAIVQSGSKNPYATHSRG